jgi:hypothetical protein
MRRKLGSCDVDCFKRFMHNVWYLFGMLSLGVMDKK